MSTAVLPTPTAPKWDTFSHEDLVNGLEPDECFDIQNIEVVRPLNDIDLSVHPPLNLAIEVNDTNSTPSQEPVYTQLGVPELWRFDDTGVVFLIRQPDSACLPQSTSRAFPAVNSAELLRFVMSHTHLDEATFLLNHMSWSTGTLIPQRS
jgi:Uma2 family endonuclease